MNNNRTGFLLLISSALLCAHCVLPSYEFDKNQTDDDGPRYEANYAGGTTGDGDSSGGKPGNGDGDGDSSDGGSSSSGGRPDSGGSTGDGGSTDSGGATGDGGGNTVDPTDADFVEQGRGTVGQWDGYLFAVAGDNSDISPTQFLGSNLCVEGTLGAGYEEWAMVGWSIAQDIDPETSEGGDHNAIVPGGSGIEVQVLNRGGSGLRVQIQTDDMGTEIWCAPVPPAGGVIPWSSFQKECWTTDGEVYDGVTPIAMVSVQTYAGSDTLPTAFDYCVLHLGPAL